MDIATDFIDDDQPALSVESMEEELIGYYANGTGNGAGRWFAARHWPRFVRSGVG